MRKEYCKNGKKYMLMGSIGMFGPSIYWADNIKDFRTSDLDDLKRGEAALFKADNGNIVRIHANGKKWY